MKEILLALAIAHGADGASTYAVLSKGGIERNPIIISDRPVAVVVQLASGAVLENILLRKLAYRHSKWARTLAVLSFVTTSTVTMQNLGHVMRPGR